MPSAANVLAFFKRYALPICLVLAMLFACRYCYDAAKANDAYKAEKIALTSSDSLVSQLRASDVHDTMVITDTLRKLDTLWRIRTLILTKVDSAWMHSDSLIAQIPLSDSSCHTAYAGLKSGCELLKKQVISDSAEMSGLASTLSYTKTQLSSSAAQLNDLKSQLNIVKKPYNCKILFVDCPSRTVSFFLGAAVVGTAKLILDR